KNKHNQETDRIIQECLKDVTEEVRSLLPLLEELEELEKERQVAKSGVIKINLETQAKILDSVLEKYEFFQNDVDINGLRVKKIAKQVLKEARKEGLKELVAEKEKNMHWTFDW
ncbi:MAG: hypothetical protein AABX37_00315, partial [Nanoarchaeota archaeon]